MTAFEQMQRNTEALVATMQDHRPQMPDDVAYFLALKRVEAMNARKRANRAAEIANDYDRSIAETEAQYAPTKGATP